MDVVAEEACFRRDEISITSNIKIGVRVLVSVRPRGTLNFVKTLLP